MIKYYKNDKEITYNRIILKYRKNTPFRKFVITNWRRRKYFLKKMINQKRLTAEFEYIE